MEQNPAQKPAFYTSTNQLEVAFGLSDMLIEELRKKQPGVARQLEDFRTQIWEPVAQERPEDRDQRIEKFAQELVSATTDRDERIALMSGMLRLGQCYDMAALVARDNFLKEQRDHFDDLPEKLKDRTKSFVALGSKTLVEDSSSLEKAMEKLSRPVFEITTTAHPTNVNSEESIRGMREMARSLYDLRRGKGSEDKLRQAIAQWIASPPIPQKDGEHGKVVSKNLTVSDETELDLRYAEQMYHDVVYAYRLPDESLQQKAEAEGKTYNKQDLRLNIRFNSWGASADKDGNDKVNSETTLESIILHKLKAVELYLHDLGEVHERNVQREIPVPISGGMGETWNERLRQAQEKLKPVLHDVREEMKKNGTFLTPQRFAELSHAAAAAVVGLDRQAFEHDLEKAYLARPEKERNGYNGDVASKLLDVLRRERVFGFEMQRLEYRETSDEYTHAVGYMLDEYAKGLPEAQRKALGLDKSYFAMGEFEREALLSQLVSGEKGVKAQDVFSAVREHLEEKGAQRPYDKKDFAPIAYQSMQRMMLARDFPDMVVDHDLAECKHTSQLQEALFLQSATTNQEGKRAVFNIIPLFEEPAVMKRVGSIMEDAYKDPAYLAHVRIATEKMHALGLTDNGVEKVQQIQIAHSDNSRRSGLPAAHALIFKAHDIMRELNAKYGIHGRFFEGKSMSDPFRGGVRSIVHMNNEYGTHNFIKTTFQGGDLVNYFTYPGSPERLFDYVLSQASYSMEEEQKLAEKQQTPSGLRPERDTNLREFNQLAIKAGAETLEDYEQNIFANDKIGAMFNKMHDPYGNIGSRAKARGGSGAIDVHNIRTILFSESFQHAGVIPNWFGSLHFADALQQALVERTQEIKATGSWEERKRCEDLLGIDVHDRAAVHQAFYAKSSLYRDIVSNIAYGVAFSEVEKIPQRFGKEIENDPFYRDRLLPEYREAARLVLDSLPMAKGKKPPTDTEIDHMSFAQLRDAVRARMPHLKETIEHKANYMTGVQVFKGEERRKEEPDPYIMTLQHNLGATVYHARIPIANDAGYRMLHLASQNPEYTKHLAAANDDLYQHSAGGKGRG